MSSQIADFPPGGAALVVGATGGIGAALVTALERDATFARVLGAGRAAGVLPAIDLREEESIAALAQSVSGLGTALRLVVVATGFLSNETYQPERTWRALDPRHMALAFALNAIGPALLMKHLLPLMPRGGKSVFAVLSARVGSIGDNRLGGWHSYRASKAALNQLVRTHAVELARNRPDACLVALHPGTVATKLSAPFAKPGPETRPPDIAARDLLAVIARLTAADSGGFFAYDGTPVPW